MKPTQHNLSLALLALALFTTTANAGWSKVNPDMDKAGESISKKIEEEMEKHTATLERLNKEYLKPSKAASVEKAKILNTIEYNNRKAGVALAKVNFYTTKIQEQKITLQALRQIREDGKGWFALWKVKHDARMKR